MCGILAYISANQAIEKGKFAEALNAIKHRGPDGCGIKDLGWTMLGHTRLSILDVEGGQQPMSTKDGRYHITFNGEIYNYIELRKALRNSGHVFYTSCDTEVLLYAYIEWGEGCLHRLRGMFAFVIVDTQASNVFIARDRLGIKPLLVYEDEDRVIVSSELAPIRKITNGKLDININAIYAYLRLGYIPYPLSIFKQVKKIAPAAYVLFGKSSRMQEARNYWDVDYEPDCSRSEESFIDELDCLLEDSVRLHMRSDVSYGAFLSGGVDSSLIVSYMAGISGQEVQTFTMGFEAEGYASEIPYARTVSDLIGTNHTDQNLTWEELLKLLPDIASKYGEPFGDHSAVPLMAISRLASGNVKMVLSGDGADEVFAGYERYIRAVDYWKYKKLPGWAKFLSSFRGNNHLGISELAHWHSQARMFTNDEVKKIFNGSVSEDIANIVPENSYNKMSGKDYISSLQYMDIKSYLPGDILTKVDIASMSYGLEVRVPFLDHKIVEFSSGLPSNLLMSCDKKVCVSKSILKKIACRRFDKDFVYRKKRGFGIPLVQWIGGNSQMLNEMVLNKNSKIYDILSYRDTAEMLTSSDTPMRTRKIWLLWVLDQWLNANLGKPDYVYG